MLFQLALLGRDVELLSADFRFVEVSLLSLIQKAGSLGVCIRLPVGLQAPVVGGWASLVGHKLVVGYRGTAISIVAVVWRLGRRFFEQPQTVRRNYQAALSLDGSRHMGYLLGYRHISCRIATLLFRTALSSQQTVT